MPFEVSLSVVDLNSNTSGFENLTKEGSQITREIIALGLPFLTTAANEKISLLYWSKLLIKLQK